MSHIKDQLYNFLVTKNENVKYEYERYVIEHTVEHYENRMKHWKILSKLNWHYRIQKKNSPLLYWDDNFFSIESPIEQKPKVNASDDSQKNPVPKKKESKSLKQSTENKTVNLEEILMNPDVNNIPQKRNPYDLARVLMNYDVISFDIFDTLLFRPFEKPTDLFIILQDKWDYVNFYNIRIEMEKKAREIAFINTGCREITIDDIYTLIEKNTGINKEKGIETEISLEKELIRPNPYMRTVFNLLKYAGKHIIICSDMYLSSEVLNEILHKCGYSGYQNLFVSCECHGNKGTGDLYDIVQAKLKLKDTQKICHVGDNYPCDIKCARAHGWDAIHYPTCNDRYKKKRYVTYSMSELIGSAYGGIVNTKMYCGYKKFSKEYKYGYINAGLYVLGYCNYIKQYAEQNNIDKILFLSRDGAIYEKVYQQLPGSKTDFTYVYWSRLASTKLLAEKDKYDFITRIIRHRRNDLVKVSVISIMEMLNLQSLLPILKEKYGFSENDVITKSNAGYFENFFLDNWDEILKIFSIDQEITQTYFEKKIRGCKNVCVVDIGWQGSGCLGVKWLIEQKWKMDCKVHCLLAGSKAASETANLNYLENNTIHTYMFSRIYNRDVFDWFAYRNNHTNTGNFEVFTQAQLPSFMGFNLKHNGKDLEYGFGIPEVENYKIIEEVHNGIYDFCHEYIDIFKNYPYMFNISGRDAIQPFRYSSGRPGYIRAVIGDFVFSRNVCADFNTPVFETIEQFLDKQEVR